MTRLYRSITSQSLHYYSRPHSGIPRAPITGPAAWYGRDLGDSSVWTYRIDADDRAELHRALEHAQATGKPTHALTAADFPLPGLGARIAHWRNEVQQGRGFVLIRGLPINDWSSADCERVFWCLGWHLGLPGAQNRFGELLGHVRDTGADPDDPTVREYRTPVAIRFHCDNADAVGLLCVNTASSGGESRIASSVTVFNELLATAPQLVPRLFQPFTLDARGEGGLRWFPVTPARHYAGELRSFWHSGYFESAARYADAPPLDDAGRELIARYDEIASRPDVHLEMALEPGDLQLCSNHTIVHSRAAYQDHEDPARRRHLLRLWLSLPAQRSLSYRARVCASSLQLLAALALCKLRQRQQA